MKRLIKKRKRKKKLHALQPPTDPVNTAQVVEAEFELKNPNHSLQETLNQSPIKLTTKLKKVS